MAPPSKHTDVKCDRGKVDLTVLKRSEKEAEDGKILVRCTAPGCQSEWLMAKSGERMARKRARDHHQLPVSEQTQVEEEETQKVEEDLEEEEDTTKVVDLNCVPIAEWSFEEHFRPGGYPILPPSTKIFDFKPMFQWCTSNDRWKYEQSVRLQFELGGQVSHGILVSLGHIYSSPIPAIADQFKRVRAICEQYALRIKQEKSNPERKANLMKRVMKLYEEDAARFEKALEEIEVAWRSA